MRSAFILATLSILLLTSPVSADSSACTADNSVAVSIRAMLRSPDRYLHKCVHLHGLLAFRAIHESLASLYEKDGTAEPHEIAVYASEKDEEDLWSVRSLVDVIGEATTCDAIGQDAVEAQAKTDADYKGSSVETIVMVIGQCHYRAGPAINVSHTDWHYDETIRLTGESNRSLHGDLKRVNPEDRRLKRIRPAVETWFEGVRQRNQSAMFGIKQQWPADMIAMMMDPKVSPVRSLMASDKPFVIEYFRNEGARISDSMRHEVRACVCLKETCKGLWPISMIDTYEYKAWPYWCLSSSDDDLINLY